MRAPIPEIAGTYELEPGVTITVSDEAATDFCMMRAAQMSALAHVINGEDFGLWSDTVQSNTRWLLSVLAKEIAHLIPIIATDAATAETPRKGSKS